MDLVTLSDFQEVKDLPTDHWLNGHEFEQTSGDGEGQGSMVCCSSWGCKELDTTEGLNKNDNTDFSQLETQGGRAKITKISSRFFTQWKRTHFRMVIDWLLMLTFHFYKSQWFLTVFLCLICHC